MLRHQPRRLARGKAGALQGHDRTAAPAGRQPAKAPGAVIADQGGSDPAAVAAGHGEAGGGIACGPAIAGAVAGDGQRADRSGNGADGVLPPDRPGLACGFIIAHRTVAAVDGIGVAQAAVGIVTAVAQRSGRCHDIFEIGQQRAAGARHQHLVGLDIKLGGLAFAEGDRPGPRRRGPTLGPPAGRDADHIADRLLRLRVQFRNPGQIVNLAAIDAGKDLAAVLIDQIRSLPGPATGSRPRTPLRRQDRNRRGPGIACRKRLRLRPDLGIARGPVLGQDAPVERLGGTLQAPRQHRRCTVEIVVAGGQHQPHRRQRIAPGIETAHEFLDRHAAVLGARMQAVGHVDHQCKAALRVIGIQRLPDRVGGCNDVADRPDRIGFQKASRGPDADARCQIDGDEMRAVAQAGHGRVQGIAARRQIGDMRAMRVRGFNPALTIRNGKIDQFRRAVEARLIHLGQRAHQAVNVALHQLAAKGQMRLTLPGAALRPMRQDAGADRPPAAKAFVRQRDARVDHPDDDILLSRTDFQPVQHIWPRHRRGDRGGAGRQRGFGQRQIRQGEGKRRIAAGAAALRDAGETAFGVAARIGFQIPVAIGRAKRHACRIGAVVRRPVLPYRAHLRPPPCPRPAIPPARVSRCHPAPLSGQRAGRGPGCAGRPAHPA